MSEDRRSPKPDVNASVSLPDKLFFRIGEVSKLTGVEPYVLRYWEEEFDCIKPQKSSSQQRLYRRKDVEIILQIIRLLYREKYTIAGAKARLKELQSGGRVERSGRLAQLEQTLAETRQDIVSLLASIGSPKR